MCIPRINNFVIFHTEFLLFDRRIVIFINTIILYDFETMINVHQYITHKHWAYKMLCYCPYYFRVVLFNNNTYHHVCNYY